MKLSVVMPTYNHGKFISRAVESVLMQETDFEFELLIGEDGSTDGTREIVQRYKELHPKKVRLFLNDRTNIVYINGHPTGRRNLITLLGEATGEYVALLEGDDYWIDPAKLQKQVDFLDQNDDFVLCCHNTRQIFGDDPETILHVRPDWSDITADVLTVEDQIRSVISFHTSSVVFRNGVLELPDFFWTVASADIALFTMLAKFGKIKYLDEVMSVYRKHAGGVSQTHHGEVLFLDRLRMNRHLDEFFDGNYTHLFREINERLYWSLFEYLIEKRHAFSLAKWWFVYLISKDASDKGLTGKSLAISKRLGRILARVTAGSPAG